MSTLNLLGTTNVTGKTSYVSLSTATGNIITNASGSSTVNKLNTVVLSNYTAGTVYANVVMNRSATSYFLAGNVAVPGYSTLVLLGKDTAIYMEEGDVLQANVSVNSSVNIAASYELMS